MKSEHRHELKTNDLAQWLAKLPQWTKENHKTIIGIIALIAVIICFFSWRFYKNKEQERERLEFTSLLNSVTDAKWQIVSAQMQGADLSYIFLERVADLKNFAEKTSSDNIAAISLIKQAEALRTELHYRQGDISKQVLTQQINQAKAAYTKAIELTSSNVVLRAIATFGLGLCAEELGNFDEAKQVYQNIIDNPNFEGTTTVIQVQQRLKTMSDYEQDIAFLPAPIPEPNITIESPEPQTLPFGSDLPFDINIPMGVDIPTESNLPVDTNLPIDSNLTDNVNLTNEVNLPQVMPVDIPQAPDLKTTPQTPNNISKDLDVNVPVE